MLITSFLPTFQSHVRSILYTDITDTDNIDRALLLNDRKQQ